jgi:hypothetical protein
MPAQSGEIPQNIFFVIKSLGILAYPSGLIQKYHNRHHKKATTSSIYSHARTTK